MNARNELNSMSPERKRRVRYLTANLLLEQDISLLQLSPDSVDSNKAIGNAHACLEDDLMTIGQPEVTPDFRIQALTHAAIVFASFGRYDQAVAAHTQLERHLLELSEEERSRQQTDPLQQRLEKLAEIEPVQR